MQHSLDMLSHVDVTERTTAHAKLLSKRHADTAI